MLAIEQLEAAYYGGIRVCAETTDDDGSGWDAAGLRAVEAAVRADQIEQDAMLAERQDYGSTIRPETAEADARARAIAAAIRAQPGGGQ